MNYFIGVRGVQSGPFEEAVIRAKQANGEFPSDALCWAEGWPQWRPLTSVFVSNTPPPPPLPTAIPQASFTVAEPVGSTPPTTSGLAITSLVLGVCGLILFITAIPAVICGHIACSNIKNSKGAQKGRGLAIAGLVLGYIIVAIIPVGLMAAMAIPAFQKVRSASQEKAIINNLRQLDAAAQQWMLEKGVHQAAYADLVGPGSDKYIRTLAIIAGEDYSDLVIRETDREISVTTSTGRVITLPRFYTSNTTDFSAPAPVAR